MELSKTLLTLPADSGQFNKPKPPLGYRGMALALSQNGIQIAINAFKGEIRVSSSAFAQTLSLYDERKSLEIQMLKECQANNPGDGFYEDLILTLQEQ